MKLILKSKDAYCNGTRQYDVINSAGVRIGSALQGNRPFADIRLIRANQDILRFDSKTKMLAYLNVTEIGILN